MDVRFISDSAVEQHAAGAVADLLARDDGVLWVDIDVCDNAAVAVLRDAFGFHPLAIRDCVERNRVPKMHVYADHVFVVLHGPERGHAGHIHYIELDEFIGPNYLVTVHGPVNPAVDPAVMVRETRAVLRRIEAGRLRPSTPFELSYAILSAMARHMEALVEQLTADGWRLEQRMTAGDVGDPEQFLEELFRTRHGLLAVRTMGALAREIHGRIATLSRFVPPGGRPFVDDVVDQFDRVRAMAEGQKEYVEGVIEFYRTRTETKMTIAAERLAVIAVVTLPITALASIYGMNLIVGDRTDIPQLTVVVVVMAAMSAALLTWAKRQGWW